MATPRIIHRAMQDILFDPQTSGGLLIAVAEKDAQLLFNELKSKMDGVSIVGYVEEKENMEIVVE